MKALVLAILALVSTVSLAQDNVTFKGQISGFSSMTECYYNLPKSTAVRAYCKDNIFLDTVTLHIIGPATLEGCHAFGAFLENLAKGFGLKSRYTCQ